MTDETGATSNKRMGRPNEWDELALLAYSAPKIDQGHTLEEICSSGFCFLYPELGGDRKTIVCRIRGMSPDTMKRQERKARASLQIAVLGLVKHIPANEAERMAQQSFTDARYTWGGRPKIPAGFLPSRKPKPGRPPMPGDAST